MAARHILIQYAGAPTSQATRTRAEALALAEQTVAELKAGADFGALAAERSGDASNAQVGGFLGAFSSGTMVPEFERALLALSPGELSKPVETPYGFHIIQRVAVLERHFATIYVAILPDGSYAQPRTPAEAHARAELALARVEAGEPFGAVARHWSDGRGAKWGGDMGLVQQGTYPPALDGPLFALEPGEHTAVLDSKLGSHIFVRLE